MVCTAKHAACSRASLCRWSVRLMPLISAPLAHAPHKYVSATTLVSWLTLGGMGANIRPLFVIRRDVFARRVLVDLGTLNTPVSPRTFTMIRRYQVCAARVLYFIFIMCPLPSARPSDTAMHNAICFPVCPLD